MNSARFVEALDGLGALRRSVETGTVSRTQALEFYNRLVDPCYSFLLTLHALDDVEMERQARALVGLVRAREMLSREDALIASSLTTRKITADEIRALSDFVAKRELYYETNLEVLPAGEREIYGQYWRSPKTAPLRDAEERLITAGPVEETGASEASRWQAAATPVIDDLGREAKEAGVRYQDRFKPAAYSVFVKAGVAGVLGFLALLVSVIVSVRIGRDLVRDLSRLRKEAHEVSGVRLPSVMRRLAAGEHVDVETEAPRLDYDSDEIGQAGQALNTLQRAAVEAAVRQADMRRGVSEVFVNLARRNQVLLHRQLTLLDTMERRTEDTEELADLFRLDHLTTRMRRHAEGLVILSGAAPSRQWRKPIQLMDVVRAAVAEVEDYERIEVRRLPRIGVGGPAVADLTHLIAELLENATVFSPPHTGVQVHGERVANGFTLEIHDRGLGMAPEVLLDANLRLAETPEFELSDTDRLGLFVVSRLAQRQNVRVSLQPSPYGGTTAVVFIPAALLTEAPETQGTGFRLDRKSESAAGRRGSDGKLSALAKVPTGLGGSALLDGPVELEPPVGALGFDDRPVLGGVDSGPVSTRSAGTATSRTPRASAAESSAPGPATAGARPRTSSTSRRWTRSPERLPATGATAPPQAADPGHRPRPQGGRAGPYAPGSGARTGPRRRTRARARPGATSGTTCRAAPRALARTGPGGTRARARAREGSADRPGTRIRARPARRPAPSRPPGQPRPPAQGGHRRRPDRRPRPRGRTSSATRNKYATVWLPCNEAGSAAAARTPKRPRPPTRPPAPARPHQERHPRGTVDDRTACRSTGRPRRHADRQGSRRAQLAPRRTGRPGRHHPQGTGALRRRPRHRHLP